MAGDMEWGEVQQVSYSLRGCCSMLAVFCLERCLDMLLYLLSEPGT